MALKTLFLLATLLALYVTTAHAKTPEPSAISRYAKAIRAIQVSDGAIPMGPAGQGEKVIPYFANLAAIGLVVAYEQDRDPENLAAARRWAGFYRAHMRPDGTVQDLSGKPGAWAPTGDADSTDSYAATYLSLLEALTDATGDTAWLRARYASVGGAIRAIRLTLQPNGLTIAKPSWPVMYTMDNVEVWRGLEDAARLARRVGKDDDAREWAAMAAGVRRALESELWDGKRPAYLIGIQTDGGRMEGLSAWYPDVMANLMAIGWGPRLPRHAPLYRRLRAEFGQNLPRAVRSEDDMDPLVWWGFAAQAEKDHPRARAISARLATADVEKMAVRNPALLGHAIRLMAGFGPGNLDSTGRSK